VVRFRRYARPAAAYLAAVVAGSLLVSAAAALPAAVGGSQVNAAIDYWDNLEIDTAVLEVRMPSQILVQTSDGQRVAVFYAENRVPVDSLDDVSPTLVDAVLSVEDRDFYVHGPIDVSGTLRALARNVTTGTQQGGSTITQQYAKLLRAAAGQDDEAKAEATEGTLHRKIVELRYAAELERVQTKDEILLGYLNAAYFGDGAYGVGSAAEHYFGVPASELDLPQSAMLAGLLRNPNAYNPNTDPQAAAARRSVALSAMVANGVIDEAARAQAEATEIGAGDHDLPNGCATSPWPYYCDWVRATILTDDAFGATPDERAATLYEGGFTVTVALDPEQMKIAQEQVDDALGRQDVAAATAVVEPGTGHVTAIAVSRDYADSQFNIPVQGQLQIGSTFKPITYAAALVRGMAPQSRLSAPNPYVPRTGNFPRGGFSNLDGISRGPIDARTALKFSVNTWFVKLAEQTDVQQVADTAYALGMTSMNPATRGVGDGDLSITLGAFETTVVDAANVYATLAASGVACRAVPIVAVHDTTTGDGLPAPDPGCHQGVPAAVADTVMQALHATAERGGTAQDVQVAGQDWVGKTGTTNNYGATWFIGATRAHAAAVWVGDPRGPTYPTRNVTAWGTRHARVYGSTVAAPLWGRLMRALTDGEPRQAYPAPGPLTTSGFTFPDVRGASLPAALAVLGAIDIEPHVQYDPQAAQPAGTVVSQTPEPGTGTPAATTLVIAGEAP